MAGQLLYTIGYEGSFVEAFAHTLLDARVGRVIDIRCVPFSRRRGFSKQALAREMDRRGIAYVHIGALGNPKPGREAARTGDLKEFQSIFCSHLDSSEAKAALEQAVALATRDSLLSGVLRIRLPELSSRSRCASHDTTEAVQGDASSHVQP